MCKIVPVENHYRVNDDTILPTRRAVAVITNNFNAAAEHKYYQRKPEQWFP